MYLEIDEGFPDHPKTMEFCGILENSEAWSHLIRLWRWACRCAPSGDLSGMKPRSIELAMGWTSLDGRAFAAAVEAGFIDQAADGTRTIHNWASRTGGAIAKMADEAARKKRWRAHKDKKCDGAPTCEFCAKEVGRREQASPAPVHDEEKTIVVRPRPLDATTQSSQVKTRPDQSSQDPDPEKSAEPAGPASPLVASLTLLPPVSASADPSLLVFPTVPGIRGGASEWHLTARAVALLSQGFPDIDVMGECRRALVWVEANRQKRKTADGMLAFLNGWLTRVQNGGNSRSVVPGDSARAPPRPAGLGQARADNSKNAAVGDLTKDF